MIKIDASKTEISQAKFSHELLLINLILVHIFLGVALMKFIDIKFAVNVPIVISLLIIAWTVFKTRKLQQNASYFVYLHWQKSLDNYRILVGAYIYYWLVVGGNALLSSDVPADSMSGNNPFDLIVLLAAIVPLFLTLLFLFAISSGLAFNAGNSEYSKEWDKTSKKINARI